MNLYEDDDDNRRQDRVSFGRHFLGIVYRTYAIPLSHWFSKSTNPPPKKKRWAGEYPHHRSAISELFIKRGLDLCLMFFFPLATLPLEDKGSPYTLSRSFELLKYPPLLPSFSHPPYFATISDKTRLLAYVL